MAMNSSFGQIMEEGDSPCFFKILRKNYLSSETMRGIPYSCLRSIPDKDFGANMVLELPWGSSWPIKVSKNPKLYYMEKTGWEKFVSDNSLGNNEFVTFTHIKKMRFTVNIYQMDCKEMLIPRNSATIASSSGRNKRERGKNIYEVESCSESNNLGRKKKVETSKMKMKPTLVPPQFIITLRNSHLSVLGIPKEFVDKHLSEETTMFKIHHWKRNKSWEVKYVVTNVQSRISAGWIRLVKDLGLGIGDVCNFKLINPTELLLKVTKNKSMY